MTDLNQGKCVRHFRIDLDVADETLRIPMAFAETDQHVEGCLESRAPKILLPFSFQLCLVLLGLFRPLGPERW